MATGPSLTAEQIEYLHQRRAVDSTLRVIAVNEAALREFLPLACPWADALYAADRKWWLHYRPAFYGWRFSGEPINEDNGKPSAVITQPLECLQRSEKVMPREPGKVISGDHSGFQALGLALTLGASKIVLLGYDCGGGKRNCHDNRHSKFVTSQGAFLNKQDFYNMVPTQWKEVEVLNCSPRSAITAFPKVTIEEAL